MATKSVAAFDVDGVVISSQLYMSEEIKKQTGLKVSLGDWREYDYLVNLVAKHLGQSTEQVAKWLFGDDVMAKAKPIQGAKETLEKLANRCVDIFFITARPEKQREITENSLINHFTKRVVSPKNVIMRPKGSTVAYKLDVLLEIRPFMYVDDSSHVLEMIAKDPRFNFCQLFIMDQPWNQGFENPRVLRVHSWNELEVYLNQILSQLKVA